MHIYIYKFVYLFVYLFIFYMRTNTHVFVDDACYVSSDFDKRNACLFRLGDDGLTGSPSIARGLQSEISYPKNPDVFESP